MNAFLTATVRFINYHGNDAAFVKVTEGAYDVETGSASNTETSTNIKTYKKHLLANQYRFPNLVGKDIAEFYVLANALSSKPEPKDKIVIGSDTYTIDSVVEHRALKEVILYCVIGVKS
jgi:hypothetical protein